MEAVYPAVMNGCARNTPYVRMVSFYYFCFVKGNLTLFFGERPNFICAVERYYSPVLYCCALAICFVIDDTDEPINMDNGKIDGISRSTHFVSCRDDSFHAARIGPASPHLIIATKLRVLRLGCSE